MAFDHRALIENVSRAFNALDLAALSDYFTEDYVNDYPQSGERIKGLHNFRATLQNYPNGILPGATPPESVRVAPNEERWIVTPMYTVQRVEGSGLTGTATFMSRYPNGSTWWVVQMYELRGEKIAKATTFFAQAFEAPEWRAPYVERMPERNAG